MGVRRGARRLEWIGGLMLGSMAMLGNGGTAARAQLAAPAAAPAPVTAPAPAPALPAPAIDPQALAALDRMGAFLRAQSAMAIGAEMTTDDVLPSGQKVQTNGVATLKISRPDRLRAEVLTDRKSEQLIYDGKTFTIYQPALRYYASFDAPPTLAQLVDVAEQRYGIDLPLADLFYWGSDRSSGPDIKGAVKLETSMVKGRRCDHYAFHQSDVDWEIFIEQGPRPLPRKLVVTTTTERSQPQHVAVLTWQLGPSLDPTLFTFVPPPNTYRIAFDVATTN
jgi:hypothetical protein